jgi:hypothetical protein
MFPRDSSIEIYITDYKTITGFTALFYAFLLLLLLISLLSTPLIVINLLLFLLLSLLLLSLLLSTPLIIINLLLFLLCEYFLFPLLYLYLLLLLIFPSLLTEFFYPLSFFCFIYSQKLS